MELLICSGVWIFIFHVLELYRLYECAVYTFLAFIALTTWDGLVRMWDKGVQAGVSDATREFIAPLAGLGS